MPASRTRSVERVGLLGRCFVPSVSAVAWFSAITFPLVRASLKGKVVRPAELVDRLKHEELVTLPTLTREEIEITGSLDASLPDVQGNVHRLSHLQIGEVATER